MPTGWLLTRNGYVLSSTVWSSPPPAATACGQRAAAARGPAQALAREPGSPGFSDYVCVGPQFGVREPNPTASDGWYYAGPWPSEARPDRERLRAA